ncbi:hypothetical protein E2F46_08970 [Luteimonas aestuarii]|uniref:Sugar transporter n=1 Tax=Luteimonas aestuarii TaxID=453837 RepID=A0A4R5TTR5_9GAMM|nr:hypothetical protein [Luteimonas aestuarii]TDK24400.1 hypothetical protein E2F46_08970 [Luteimonas aestuarii]
MTTNVPVSFRVVSVLALLWNLTGVTMFFLQTRMTPEQIAALPDEQRVVYEAMPSWLAIFYGLAVFGGALGSLGLLLRRRWALPLLVISLAAVLVQMIAIYVVTPAWQASGASGLPMSLLIVGIAAFLFWYARRASARGWLR